MNCFEGFRFLFPILKSAIFPWISYTEAIVSRKLLYCNPDRLSPKISYDGEFLAFMARKVDVMEYYWTYGNEILYSQDYKGDEYAIVKINKPDPTAYSLYKINIITGVYALIESSEYSFTEYVVADSLKFRCTFTSNKRIPTAYSVTYLKDDWYPIDEKISLDLKVLREYNNEKYVLDQVFPFIIKSQDQLDLVCYLTLPPDEHDSSKKYMPKHPLPLVLRVRCGPWSRDYYSFKVDSQFFASRGYAVLNVNFRSSVGLGKTLIRKGIGEWGKKMNDDLIVAVEYLISKNIDIKEKVAIYGVSYGGYAALASLAELTFACGIEYSGPSDLEKSLSIYLGGKFEEFDFNEDDIKNLNDKIR
ncbi:9272_t:CDS:2 [Gigaspora margarita]|uniref:Dipeptidyl-peptidase V n=1 Tax=Gigaspora margarita TaxID=4874 RepID=A0ABN7VMV5_GIGMA|nr:9272_t:CDS:2 [Gigaspora margarita]